MGSRDQILGRIRDIRRQKIFDEVDDPGWDGEELSPITEDLDVTFKKELEAVSGTCFLVEHEAELSKSIRSFFIEHNVNRVACLNKNLHSLIPDEFGLSGIKEADASITECETLIARTGSAILSSGVALSRSIQIFPPIHIIIAKESQLQPYLSDGIKTLETKYGKDFPSQVSLITGPSRTADIEKTLVLGAHGPKELLVIIIKNK